MDAIVRKHAQKAKEKYSISKEINKFSNQLDITPNEIDKE